MKIKGKQIVSKKKKKGKGLGEKIHCKKTSQQRGKVTVLKALEVHRESLYKFSIQKDC